MHWCGHDIAVDSKTVCMRYDPVVQDHTTCGSSKVWDPWSGSTEGFIEIHDGKPLNREIAFFEVGQHIH